MPNSSQDINRAVAGELCRIVLFVLYYVLHILIGIGLFVGAFFVGKISLWLLTTAHVLNFGLITLGIAFNIAVWILAAMLGFYLVKPLFKFTKNQNPKRVEVTESDCPQLFQMIHEVALATRCKMPKHVYLSPDVNACVFYDTSFWSIFFPVRKNLEIGLGLFDGLNVSEVQAIIGHEFGHFAQDSMKVGSAVYITNTVLYNLIYTDDNWDRRINKMRLSDLRSLRIAGELTHWLTGIIKQNTIRMYRFVEKGYLKLSRYMEFDADRVACRAFGSNIFISALCKLSVLSYEEQHFEDIFTALLNDNKTVANYFQSKHITDRAIPRYGMPTISAAMSLASPYQPTDSSSKVQVEDIWRTHPTTQDRIANAQLIGTIKSPNCSDAWSLLPEAVQDKVSRHLLQLVSGTRKDVQTITAEDFKHFVSEIVKQRFFREDLVTFFQRDILPFDASQLDVSTTIASPFNEANRTLIRQYNALVQDYQTLLAVHEKRIDAQEVKYDGVIYNRKNVPLAQLRQEYDVLVQKVVEIDKAVYVFLYQNSSADKQQHLTALYNALGYTRYMQNTSLPELQQKREAFIAELNQVTRRDEAEFDELLYQIQRFGTYAKQFIAKLDYACMAQWIPQNVLQYWHTFSQERHEYYSAVDNTVYTETLNELVVLLGNILEAFANCSPCINAQLGDIAQDILPMPK